jgi:hypothetical protein
MFSEKEKMPIEEDLKKKKPPISTTQSGLKKKNKKPIKKDVKKEKTQTKTYIKYMLPIEKDKKKTKLKAVKAVRGAGGVRGVGGARQATKKPSTSQIVNIFTSEPVRTDFRQQMPLITREQQPIVNPFAPVFNIQQPFQQPVQQPTPSIMKVEEKKPSVDITEPKPRKKYTRKPVVVGIPVSSGYESERPMMSRQSSGYMAEEEDIPITSTTAKGEFIAGTERSIVAEVPKSRRGRPAGSKNKPKENPFTLPVPAGQQDITRFLTKSGGESSNIGGGSELNII